VSLRGVQLVIGRLVTDGMFRRRVERGGSAYLASLQTRGVVLTRTEIAALVEMDPRVWASVAKQIDHSFSLNGRPANDGNGPPIRQVLTEQQHRVLVGVGDGLRTREIAAELGISESAVKATIQQLFRKLSVRRRVQLVRFVLDEPSWRTDRPRAVRRAKAEVGAHETTGGGIAHAS
jgi:DNA-binding CsgD family transcriptional regulator